MIKYINMNIANDTICAFSTPHGAGAVAVLRLSGPDAWAAAERLFSSEFSPEPGRVYLRKIFDKENAALLDNALITFFKAPRSFTGEDVVEIAVHGSPYIKGRLLEIFVHAGLRPARAGEFSLRAFLNGKIDLIEAQGVCDLVAASTRAAHASAMSGMDGRLSGKFKEIKETLSLLLAQIEVRLDDADGEMEALPEKEIESVLLAARKTIKDLLSTYSTGRLVKEGVKAAIIGAPNAGKSSLLNALLGFDRAIVSEESGTTRDTVEDSFGYKGQQIILVDTAGIRESKTYAEAEGIKRSLAAAGAADVILFTADASLGESAQERELLAPVSGGEKKIITVLNKSDLPAKRSGGVKVSAKTGAGIEELKEEILKAVNLGHKEGVLISSAVQYEALLKAEGELTLAIESAARGGEFTAVHIRAALHAVRETIGEVSTDDILGIIFSKFCVGK